MTGRDARAIRSRVGANARLMRSVRCNARRFGASSPTTSVTKVMTIVTPRKPSTLARPLPMPACRSPSDACFDSVTAPNALDSKRGQGDAELHRGEKAVGVGDELDDLLPATATLGERPGLALAQRNQRELGRHEQSLDDDERDDDDDVEPDAHGSPGQHSGYEPAAGLQSGTRSG